MVNTPEHGAENKEALVAADIFKKMTEIAAKAPETFQPTHKQEAVAGVGLLHWQRIGDIIGIKITQKANEEDSQGYEIDCQLKANADGSFELDDEHGPSFKVSRPDHEVRYRVFAIKLEHGEFAVQPEQGVHLTQTELQDCDQFANAMAKELPEQLAA